MCVCIHTCGLVVKNLPANSGGAGDVGLIPGLGREGNAKSMESQRVRHH